MLSTTQRCWWYEFICFMSSGLWMAWMTLSHEFRVMDDMNDLESRVPKLLDAMNSLGVMITWKIIGRELMALNAMNSSRLCITWKTVSHELRALYVMKSSGLWLTRLSLSHKLRALDSINNSQLLMTWATLGHKLTTLDAMKNSGLWIMSTTRDPVTSIL